MSRMQRFDWLARQRTHQAGRGPNVRRLHVELLEDRRMLAVITVTSLADNLFLGGGVTLREAVQAANTETSVDGSVAGSGADTIEFSAALSGDTITLGGTELEITEALTIDATALTNNVTIDAHNASRIFNITATTGDFTLAGLTLTGGRTNGDNANSLDNTFSGGAVRSLTAGSLTIDQSTVSGNTVMGSRVEGGAIYSRGPLTLTSSTLSENGTTGFFAVGGGISSYGDVTLTSSTVSGNSTAGGFASGGGIYSFGVVILTSSTVSGNSSYSFGGGIRSRSAVTLTSSTVSGNSTTGYSADGGGIISTGAVTLTSSTVSGNSTIGDTADGGGIRSNGDVTLTSSTVSGNGVTGRFADGGGIYSYGDITLTSSTVSGNSTAGRFTDGGGIWNSNDTITITNSILAGNTAADDSSDLRPGTGTLNVNYSLIGDNDGTGLSEAPVGLPDIDGNLIGGTVNGVIDPLLGPLTNNGGPTETHALLAGSPAINSGDPSIVSNPEEFDQRGAPFARVVGGHIDIGSVEDQPIPDSADFDTDGDRDGRDFLFWQRGFGTPAPLATKADGDADNDTDVDGVDLNIWEAAFGDGVGPLPASSTVWHDSPSREVSERNDDSESRPTLVSRQSLIDAAIMLSLADQPTATVDESLILDDWSPMTEATRSAALDLLTQLARNPATTPPRAADSDILDDDGITDEAFDAFFQRGFL